MSIMESTTWYLPDEVPTPRNYPEVAVTEADIQLIFSYGLRVSSAIEDYTSGAFDKIDIDVNDLLVHIALCRSVCDTLGNAPSVCYDILAEIRNIQSALQQLMYAKNRYGGVYIGTPTRL
jgi:hypothetical protein